MRTISIAATSLLFTACSITEGTGSSNSEETPEDATSSIAAGLEGSPAAALVPAAAVPHMHPELSGTTNKILSTQPGAPWQIDRIDQHTLPLDTNYSYNTTGLGVHVYMLGTGIRTTHLELTGRVSNDISFTGEPTDCNGQGTMMAGVITGSTYGVAKDAKIHAVMTLDCNNSGLLAWQVDGLDWITAHAIKPAVAVVPILGSSTPPQLLNAINNLIASGVTVNVIAPHYTCAGYPSLPGLIRLAGTDKIDACYHPGSCVDIAAPDVGLKTSGNFSDTASVAINNGLSVAVIAGAEARYLQANPSATPAQVKAWLTANATSNIITCSGGTPTKFLFVDGSF